MSSAEVVEASASVTLRGTADDGHQTVAPETAGRAACNGPTPAGNAQTTPATGERSSEDQNGTRSNDPPTAAGDDAPVVQVVLRPKRATRSGLGQSRVTNVDDGCYRACLARIRQRLAGKKIWASLDETVDPKDGEVIGNVVVGTLSPDGAGETFLLASGVLLDGGGGRGSGNADADAAAARLFAAAMGLLWPDGGCDDLLLLVSGLSGPCGRGAMAGWPAVGPRTVLVACVERQLHAAVERISAGYPAVDTLVSMVHRVFSKDPSRPSEMRARQRGRAGFSWIESATYLNENLAAVRGALIDRPDRRVSWPAWRAGRLAVAPELEPGLAFVDLNYGFLPAAAARIRARGAPLTRTVAAVSAAADRLAEVPGDLGAAVHRRFADALRENHGLRVLADVADVMAGRSVTMDRLPEHLSGNDLKYFRYAPVTAVDARETFPRLEAVFSKYNRLKYGEQSLNKLLVVQCNGFADGGASDDPAARGERARPTRDPRRVSSLRGEPGAYTDGH